MNRSKPFDYMYTIKLLSDIYPDIPPKLDCLVSEYTEWGFTRYEPKQRKILAWLEKGD